MSFIKHVMDGILSIAEELFRTVVIIWYNNCTLIHDSLGGDKER